MRHALAVIDTLHGDGNIPSLIARREILKDLDGKFDIGQGVAISTRTPIGALVTAHEIGHVLDFYGFTPGYYESLVGHEMVLVFNAWFASTACRELQALRVHLSAPLTDPFEQGRRIILVAIIAIILIPAPIRAYKRHGRVALRAERPPPK